MVTDIEIEELEEEFKRLENLPEPDPEELYEIECEASNLQLSLHTLSTCQIRRIQATT